MKKSFFLVLGLLIIFGSVVIFLKNPKITEEEGSLVIGGTEVKVEIADTDLERSQGLSGREGLLPNHGMLFVFDAPGYHAFWMKDMKFPIDIIWINADSKVVWIEKNLSPETYPNLFRPKEPAKYVLEVPAGFAEEHGVVIGSVVQ
ncbi:MAG: DUF192 domain-containing protein [Minisyncoccia bacterium]